MLRISFMMDHHPNKTYKELKIKCYFLSQSPATRGKGVPREELAVKLPYASTPRYITDPSLGTKQIADKKNKPSKNQQATTRSLNSSFKSIQQTPCQRHESFLRQISAISRFERAVEPNKSFRTLILGVTQQNKFGT